jgi:cytochrome c oxidase subunit 4
MPSQIISSAVYFKVFACLMGLLVLTVGANFIDLGPFNVAAALAISIVKALLIMLFFMEVRHSRPITWLFAGAAFAWLIIMIALTMNDYLSRSWTAQEWRDGTGRSNRVEFAAPR